jgi:hypothetical protein
LPQLQAGSCGKIAVDQGPTEENGRERRPPYPLAVRPSHRTTAAIVGLVSLAGCTVKSQKLDAGSTVLVVNMWWLVVGAAVALAVLGLALLLLRRRSRR